MIRTLRAKVREEQDGDRFDVAAASLFDSLSRKSVKAIIDAGGAYVNKKRVRVAKQEIRQGDVLELFWDDRAPEGAGRAGSEAAGNDSGVENGAGTVGAKKGVTGTAGAPAMEGPRAKFVRTPAPALLGERHVLLVAEEFVVLDKPAGLPSQATLVSSTDTVAHALAALRPKEFPLESLFLVHRLDKETSGLMVLARTKAARDHFEAAFRERRVKKAYHALTYFEPKPKAGTVSFPLVKDPARPNTYFALTQQAGSGGPGRAGGPGGPGGVGGARKPRVDAKSAVTDYDVLKSFVGAKASLVECRPETGRTHQIRVHMQALGCPLLGDKTYARNIVGHPFAQLALRHMLHAARLEFVGPRGDTYTLDAPHPPDFVACLEELEKRG